MAEIDLVIDVSWDDDWDLKDFFSSHGIRNRPDYGVFNGPMPDVSEILKHPAPYIIATAAGHLLISALKAYAQSKEEAHYHPSS